MTPGEPIEDYGNLGHTFLQGHGNRHNVITHVEVIEREERPPIDWTRLIFWAIGVIVIVLAVLVGSLIVWAIHHAHHASSAAATGGPRQGSGQVFAWIVLIAIVVAAGRYLAKLISGG